jgi:dTDP-4-dehydrorhamnose 3,5-epimerase
LAHLQAKLCRVTYGEVFDVALDIRLGSPSFGRWVGAILSAANKRQMYVPAGFAHGFVVLSEAAEVLYKCTEFYHPEDEFGVLWNDPALKIAWGVAQPLLSAKDRAHLPLAEIPPARLPRYEGAGMNLTDLRVCD